MGTFFHTLDQHGKIHKQGQVLGRSGGMVRVQWFSWITGKAKGQEHCKEQDAHTWRFYKTRKEWLDAGSKMF
jgi:hypothetical protein